MTASPVCSQPLFPTAALSLSSSVDSLAPASSSNRTTRGSLGAGSVELSLSSQSNPSTCLGLANMKSISLFQQANTDVNSQNKLYTAYTWHGGTKLLNGFLLQVSISMDLCQSIIIYVPVPYNMISNKTKFDVSYPPLSCQGN